MKRCLFFALAFVSLFCCPVRSVGAEVPDLLRRQWDARWVEVPDCDPQAYGVYLFRKELDLAAVPAGYPVWVSADNRYKLYVNGQLVSLGPARCDIEHWNFEEVDLSPYLKAGRNVIAAKVWNEGPSRAEAQFTLRTAFILQGVNEASAALNTGAGWKCVQDKAYSISRAGRVFGYSVVSPDEQVDMSLREQGWMEAGFDDSAWADPRPISPGTPKLTVGIDVGKTWRLTPSPLPQMERTPQRFDAVRRSENVQIPAGFPRQAVSVTVPAHTKASFLLDNKVLTNAFPTIVMNGGKGARVQLTYAEALVGARFSKGNRDEVEGKQIGGRTDVLLADGSRGQEYTSCFYRTFRYVGVEVETGDEALEIADLYSTFVGFPFEMRARLDTPDETMQRILEVGWRTARLCAVETYMDCPYYEQLQYGGDARIQELVSLFNAGDPRLLRSLLDQLDHSRQSEGITQSRYPSVNPQIIPTYSMAYIWMLHDYMMYVDDPDFLREKLSGARQVIDYFIRFTDEGGSIRNLPNWAFVDWAMGFMRGMSPVGSDGGSCVLDVHLLLTYQMAAELEEAYGMGDYVKLYRQRAEQLAQTIRTRYWDASKGRFADTVDKNVYSQHANALAILTGLVQGDEARNLGLQIQDDATLTQASLYFKYYTHEAMVRAGLGDAYLSWLDVWRRNLELGMTTWGETSNVESTRSDCHAWGSSPNIEFFRTILGIDSAAPGFRQVVIRPSLGEIKEIGGTMPHPAGEISVHYKAGRKLQAEISLPAGVSGTFCWKGTQTALKPGLNKLSL
ncbi:MAG: alpha-rhamnosidase [Bacteroidales bacterium]|nr:alpha-rhamnosidase [Bacteroidales bacterium]